MKIVLDTNVWLSAIFWEGEAAQIVEMAEEENFKLIVTKDILSEINEVVGKEAKFKKFLETQNIEELFIKFLYLTDMVEPSRKLNVITADPDDNKIIEAAVAGKADYILSRDKHLTGLQEFEGIRILTPTEFLKIVYRRK